MRCIIDAKDLRNTLKAIKPWVPAKPRHQILSHVLIESDHNGTHIISYDYSSVCNAVRFPLDAVNSVEGACVVKFKDLIDITAKSEGDVTLEFNNISKLNISFDHTMFTLKARPKEEFPDVPSAWINNFTSDAGHQSTATALGDFTRAIDHVFIATEPGMINKFTSGILFVIKDRDVSVVGTDGRRLHFASIPQATSESEWQALIQADIAFRIARLKVNPLNRIEFGLCSVDKVEYFTWSVDCIEGFCTLMDTPYPDWENVIPTDNEGLIEIQADNLARCIDRISPIAKSDDGRDMVVLNGNSAMTVTARAEGMGTGMSTVSCTHVAGPDMLVALNYVYLLDVLKLHKGKAIHLIFKGDLDPVMIRSRSDGTRSSILMPVRLPE